MSGPLSENPSLLTTHVDALFDRSVLLAPMAGVNDPVFRSICLNLGADLCYTEMISAKGLSFANIKTAELLAIGQSEDRLAVQLFGRDPAILADQAITITERLGDSLALIDINMGCPAKKITSQGEGAALMNDPVLAGRIISQVVAAVSVPVTVKLRRGWLDGLETAVEFARIAEVCGAQAVAVHGRWARQLYQGQADRTVIGRVKAVVCIPVIASGDVFSVEDALDYFDNQGADAVMVARGALGNPWLFRDIKTALLRQADNNSEAINEKLALIERITVARQHLLDLAEQFPHRLVTMRKHLAWYFKGVKGATAVRRSLYNCHNLADYLRLLDEIMAECL
ncbi:MAG: tRNA dihydrouridine synthase DusB [Coriobacteriales bacterium]|jgi:nifR3 family TIM-barrel protein|nr:tRNA dihydrouridine synthase DusB [Coriobacteriales bacterium]